ncbi:muellerian-inhibiting factor [Acanthopagrus latus]|uniref:muellerian-inhibiting factor n=1 Tax=Acanthopagrus latus TaxID=8177 RepID=UPI00187C9D45|nr:muellerian-inhibiting factor [Acanthopagrus latus]
MLGVDVFYCGALMLCWTRLSVALHVSHGQPLIPAHDPEMTGDHHAASSTETGDGLEIKNHAPHHEPCFVDNILAALREAVGNGGELTNRSLTLFGICTATGDPSGSVLLELTNEASRNGLEALHPAAVHLLEEDERGALKLTFDLPQSPLLERKPVLLLAFKSPLSGGNLDIMFTSQSLQPNTQPVCISGETQYMVLTGKASEDNAHQNWRISADTKSPDMKQRLRDVLTGGKSGSSISLIPLLLFSGGRGTDTRHVHGSGSSQTSSFLCELKRFLGDVMPRGQPESPPLQLTSLQSMPPLTLGVSSSETLLAGLINSSALTIFSFSTCCSVSQVHRRELALSPALAEELGQRLEQTVMQITEVIREEDVGHRATERLGRLRELSAFPKEEPATGESQYRAFLLLKALQTVARTYVLKRGQRTARAGPSSPGGANICGLRSLTVSLERHLLAPNTANIDNCQGTCSVPLVNPTNHAVLLNSHIESERAASRSADERPPCCVPVAYEALEVVDFNEDLTQVRPFENVVVKECGCR